MIRKVAAVCCCEVLFERIKSLVNLEPAVGDLGPEAKLAMQRRVGKRTCVSYRINSYTRPGLMAEFTPFLKV
jgi:hypothetical protein